MAHPREATAAQIDRPERGSRGRPAIPGLRERILEVAGRVFASQPFDRVHIDDVATAAGVAKGTVYRYFPSKEALYLAALFHGIDELQGRLLDVAAAQPDPVARLRALVAEMLQFFWGRDVFFLLLHRSDVRHDQRNMQQWLRRRERFAQLISKALEEGIARGTIRQVDPYLATEALLGMLRGVHRYRAAHDTLGDAARAVTDLFLHGVAAGTQEATERRRRCAQSRP